MPCHYKAQMFWNRCLTRKCRKAQKIANGNTGVACICHFESNSRLKPIRKEANRKLRRYKGEVGNNSWYKRFYDVWWTAF